MNIRKAKIEDLKVIQELNAGLLKKENEDFGQNFESSWAFSKEGEKEISDWIQSENSLVLVAEENGKIVGYLAAQVRVMPWRNPSKNIELTELFVLSEHRSKGFGSDLMKEFLAWCKEKDIQGVKLEATAKNKSAINFYKKHGFEDKEIVFRKKL